MPIRVTKDDKYFGEMNLPHSHASSSNARARLNGLIFTNQSFECCESTHRDIVLKDAFACLFSAIIGGRATSPASQQSDQEANVEWRN